MVICARGVLLGRDQLVLAGGYGADDIALPVCLSVQIQALDDVFHDSLLIVGIIYRKCIVIAYPVYVPAQYTYTARVKCSHPHGLCALSGDTVHALPHLRRRLIRKSNRHNIIWRYSLVLYEMRDAVCQYPCLA